MGATGQGVDEVADRWLTIPRMVAFVRNGDDILMLRRSDDSRIYPGRFNGVGGHLERDEDPLSGMRREILEETGLQVTQLRLRALYNIDAGGPQGVLLFVFTCHSASRELCPTTPEGALRWVPRHELLSLPLVEDLPQMLQRVLDLAPDAPPLFVHCGYDSDDRLRLRIAPEGAPSASST